jgi:hypothetical protein
LADVVVLGATPEVGAQIRRAIKTASKGLGWTLDIPIEIDDPMDELPESEAGVDGQRLWIRPETLDVLAPPNALAAFLAEEVAHAYLGSLGVPHASAAAVVFQESFAKWFMVRRAREVLPEVVQPALVRRILAAGAEPRMLAHRCGSLAGLTQAGVATARGAVDAELSTLPDGHPIKEFTKWLAFAQFPAAPRERAKLIAAGYKSAEQRFG